MSILSECLSDSSILSASNFAEVISYGTNTAPTSSAAARIQEWVTKGYSVYMSSDEILNNPKNQHLKTNTGISRLACMLARHTYFGERTLALSTVTRKKGETLDASKLSSMKALLKGVLHPVPPAEFEKDWNKCIESI